MSLPSRDRQTSFTDAAVIVPNLFPADSFPARFKALVMPLLWGLRDQLAGLYSPGRGRPAFEPVHLLAVTLLEFIENLPDRTACERLRTDMGWKFILDLPLDHEGIHATTLVKFRNRLAEAGLERLAFDGVAEGLRAAGFLRRSARRRLDSTHILGAVAALNRNDLMRETLRLALEALAEAGLLDTMPGRDALVERYVHHAVQWGILTKAERREKFLQAAGDALGLLRWARLQDSRVWGLDAVLLLERVVLEQCVLDGEGVGARADVPGTAVRTPHDTEVEWCTKGSLGREGWLGYKSQLEETAPAAAAPPKPKGEPTDQFLTDVHLTPATTGETEGMAAMHGGQRERGHGPGPETLVDSGYISAVTLAEAAAEGRELAGPPRPPHGKAGCFTAEDFDVDVAARTAVCPAGLASERCQPIDDKTRAYKQLRFHWGDACLTCPLQSQCTRRRDGRRSLTVTEHHALLQARRRAMKTEAYRARLRARAGVEGTISELVRGGMRRSRYRGFAKTRLFVLLMGAACNARRWVRLATWRMRQEGAAEAPGSHGGPCFGVLGWMRRLVGCSGASVAA